jgi:hypothetical protein
MAVGDVELLTIHTARVFEPLKAPSRFKGGQRVGVCTSVHTGLALSRTRIGLRRFSIMRMARREAHYRGYKIDGELKGRSWVLHVHPILPDLPILRFSSFQVVQSTWPKAVGEAVRRVEELLALSINP